ncbi:metallophosphoesterase [Microbacterium lacticum]|uniref:metallophosphoesterase n=1 Tax=Microbacterium lacticum TaxID=33885 RepID=UPI0024311D80|nr:metallophosphoesterase [Microbacterium lacticum]
MTGCRSDLALLDIDYWSRRSGIERILVTLGNHEPYNEYTPLLEAHPGRAIRVSQFVWLLPRPWRLEIHGREILSLGGAASVDRKWRTPGKDWWDDERILDEHVVAASARSADVMVTHESPDDTPVAQVAALPRCNPNGFPDDALEESAASRAQVDKVWTAVNPKLLFHGHMHVAGSGTTADGHTVVSLGRDAAEGNAALLDLVDMSVGIPSLRVLRGW